MRSPATGTPDNLGVVERFDVCILRQFELCRALEALADSLPCPVDTHASVLLVDRLDTTLRRCHRLEETLVFPVLSISNRDIGPMLDRLRTEHFEDEDHAADVREAVKAYLAHRTPAEAGEVGYMLRGLFTALRRHVAFDRDHVLPLYRRSCGL